MPKGSSMSYVRNSRVRVRSWAKIPNDFAIAQKLFASPPNKLMLSVSLTGSWFAFPWAIAFQLHGFVALQCELFSFSLEISGQTHIVYKFSVGSG